MITSQNALAALATTKRKKGSSASTINKKLIKRTHYKYVKYGDYVEIYKFERPIFYNRSPLSHEQMGSNRGESPRRSDNLAAARIKINRLVLGNTDWKVCAPRFVTFTFAENITSLKEANMYWANFIRKFKKSYPNTKYLGVVEFQKRGAVHYHVLFFNLKYKAGIKNEIRDLWGQGFIKFKSAKKIEKIHHLGLYLAKYLQKDIVDNRLIGEKAFFTSKNLTQPIFLRNEETCGNLYSQILEEGGILETYVSHYYGTINKLTLCLQSKMTQSS